MGAPKGGGTAGRHLPASDVEASAHVGCSGRTCRSCTAVLLADCIALGCCPCAVVNLLAFALIKVPWAVGRRCLRLLKKRMRDEERGEKGGGDVGKKGIEMGIMRIEVGEDENVSLSIVFDQDERVWTELYEAGHWGFGRLSFSE